MYVCIYYTVGVQHALCQFYLQHFKARRIQKKARAQENERQKEKKINKNNEMLVCVYERER